ncbi:MAG: cytochrome c family protein [Ignavibacteria bacterium]|nr:cytochrome c family protein [Ignavibacteria bacterium]
MSQSKLLFTFAAIILCAAFLYGQEAKKHAFIGAESCGMCHKSEKQGKQLDIWKGSAHAKAYEALTTEKADAIAKEKGLKTPAAKSPECLKCHTSGHDADAALIGKKFKVEDGVQCETCHGAGEDYKSMKIMKDKAEAMKNGLIVHEEKEKFCTSCHNSESPTFKEFNYDAQWAKIKHSIPAK